MKKRRIELFAEYDCTGISRHLEKMAAKGWMIESVSNYSCWTYRRIEPKKVRFAVSYYGNATIYDPQPTEKQERFYEFCSHTGWELICTKGPMQIFCNEQENPVPIETEPMLEVEAIHAIAKRTLVVVWTTLICGILMLAAELLEMQRPHVFLASPSSPYIGVLYLVLFAVCGVELISYSRWHKKAKLAAEQGGFCNTFSTAKIQKWLMLLLGIAFVAWITDVMIFGDKEKKTIILVMVGGVALLFMIVNAVTIVLRKRKVDSDLNGMVSLLFSVALAFVLWFCVLIISIKKPEVSLQDISPLNMEDIIEVSEDAYRKEYERKESRFLRNRTVSQQFVTESGEQVDALKLEYQLVEVKLPLFYQTCKKSMIKNMEKDWGAEQKAYLAVSTSAWGATEAYRLHSSKEGDLNNYLLCYENTLVQIEFSWTPTEEQKEIIRQRLGRVSK